jgi:hypothetical protein
MRHLLVSKKTAERLAGSRTLIPKNPRMRHRAPPDAVRKWTHRPLAVERRTVNSHREAIEDPVRRTERVDKKRGEIEGRLVVKAVDSREETLADKLVVKDVDSREEMLADKLVDSREATLADKPVDSREETPADKLVGSREETLAVKLVVKDVGRREETLADKLVDSREETLADQLVDKAEKVVWTDHRRIDIPGPLEPIAKKNDRRTEPLTDCISSSCRPRF